MVGDTAADILVGKAAGPKIRAVTYGFGMFKRVFTSKKVYKSFQSRKFNLTILHSLLWGYRLKGRV